MPDTEIPDTEAMPNFDDEPKAGVEVVQSDTALASALSATPAEQPKAKNKQALAPAAAKPGQVLKAGKAPPKLTDRSGDSHAMVRITKTGHGHVHDGSGGFYDWGTELVLENSVAQDLEDRSFAEIIG